MLKFSRSRYTHLFLVTTLSLSACHKAYEGDGDEMAKTPSSEETTVVNPPKMAPLREAVMKGDEKIVHDAYLRKLSSKQ